MSTGVISSGEPLPEAVLHTWVKAYLQCRQEIKGKSPDDVTDDEVTSTVKQVHVWRVVSTLLRLVIKTHLTYKINLALKDPRQLQND